MNSILSDFIFWYAFSNLASLVLLNSFYQFTENSDNVYSFTSANFRAKQHWLNTTLKIFIATAKALQLSHITLI